MHLVFGKGYWFYAIKKIISPKPSYEVGKRIFAFMQLVVAHFNCKNIKVLKQLLFDYK